MTSQPRKIQPRGRKEQRKETKVLVDTVSELQGQRKEALKYSGGCREQPKSKQQAAEAAQRCGTHSVRASASALMALLIKQPCGSLTQPGCVTTAEPAACSTSAASESKTSQAHTV